MRKVEPKKSSEEYGPLRHKGNEKIYPKLRIDLKHLPEAEDYKLGESHEIHIKGKLTSLSKSKFQNEAEFDITHIEPHDEDDEKEDGDDSAKDDEKDDGGKKADDGEEDGE